MIEGKLVEKVTLVMNSTGHNNNTTHDNKATGKNDNDHPHDT